jgi:hypothetical protein
MDMQEDAGVVMTRFEGGAGSSAAYLGQPQQQVGCIHGLVLDSLAHDIALGINLQHTCRVVNITRAYVLSHVEAVLIGQAGCQEQVAFTGSAGCMPRHHKNSWVVTWASRT